jgi:ATP-dependent Clp protease ATP-binding subunit ClpX
LPVVAVLEELDEHALIDILVKPKNALIKQYQKLFSYENVDLKFTETALKAIAKQAMDRKTGARGLRGVIETAMLDIMYEIPSMDNVKECTINEDVISKKAEPVLVFKTEEELQKAKASSAESA